MSQVANYTYACYHAGQELNIRIMAGGWLHRGAILCPPCKEICGEHFERLGLECRIREEAPPSNKFPRDELQCGRAATVALFGTVRWVSAVMATLTAVAVSSYAQWPTSSDVR